MLGIRPAQGTLSLTSLRRCTIHLIKLSEKAGGDPLHRIYDQQIQTLSDIRVLVSHLQIELLKANREGRELHVELWTEHRETTLLKKEENKFVSGAS